MTFQKRIQRTLYNLNRKYLVKGIKVLFRFDGSYEGVAHKIINYDLSKCDYYSNSNTIDSEIKIFHNLKNKKFIKDFFKDYSKKLIKGYRKKKGIETERGYIVDGKNVTSCCVVDFSPNLKPLSFEEYTNLKAKGGKRLDIE